MYQIKDIPGYPGYKIDTNGQVWSMLKQRGGGRRVIDVDELHLVKSFALSTGHLQCRAWINGKGRTLRPQIAVALAFLKNDDPENKIYVCHKDGNPQNNHPTNLYWGTPAQNTDDMRKHKTMSCGEKRWNASLSPAQIKQIISLRRDFNWNQSRIGRVFGVTQSHISRITRGLTWLHITNPL